MVESQPSSSLSIRGTISVDEKLAKGSQRNEFLENCMNLLNNINLRGCRRPRDVEKTKVKHEVRKDDESTKHLTLRYTSQLTPPPYVVQGGVDGGDGPPGISSLL